jgi:hypothetical protein
MKSWKVGVTLLIFLLLFCGVAVAKKKKKKHHPNVSTATTADLVVSVSGLDSLPQPAASNSASLVHQVTVRNAGPAAARPLVFVSTTNRVGTAPAGTPAGCVQFVGGVACNAPLLNPGGIAAFDVPYGVQFCLGDPPATTTAMATSSLADPNPANDFAAKTTAVGPSTGCG